ncbi:uncharacterized protein si:ch211-106e7.2 [Thalassophryne amazonica]|uniref:uncharacterized protein si:ch211-106e7.2 n=1 Tax=Thalassophryne amazonica TaxID=390379 RepID=UPI001471FC20|nr:uncharacterized protein si:ch211-106e7.2 [Thalassophryne amazonica]
MHSSAWTNGQSTTIHHLGQQSQSSQMRNQVLVDNMKKQNAGSVHYISQYGRRNTPQSSHNIHHNSVSSNRQPTNLQSANTFYYGTPQQPTTAGKQNNFVLGFVVGYQQNPLPLAQVGNLAVPVQLNYGSQGSNKQIHHQTVPQNTLTQSKSNMINVNSSNTVQQQRFFPPVALPSYSMAISQLTGSCNSSVTRNVSSGLLSASSMGHSISGYRNGTTTSSAIISHTSSRDTQKFLSKTNQPSVFPVANSQQQITTFANNAFQSVGCRAESQLGANSPGNGGNQLVSMVRMQSKQVLQSGTLNVIGNYNSSASQTILLQPLQSLAKTTHGTTSATWHNKDAQPLQPLANTTHGHTSATWHNKDAQPLQPLANTTHGSTSATWHNKDAQPLQLLANTARGSTSETWHNKDAQSQQPSPLEDFHFKATGDQNGNNFPGGNTVSVPNGIIIAPVLNKTQMQQLSQNIPVQMNNTPSSAEHVKGQKAVAVVQPLSNAQVANSLHCEPTTPEKALTSPTFVKTSTNLIDDTNPLKGDEKIHEELSNASKSSNSFDSHSTPSNDGSVVASLGSTKPEDSLQKQLCTAVTEPAVEKSQSDKMPRSPNGVMDRRSTPTDPNTCLQEDTPVQTVLWTLAKLGQLIEGTTTAKTKSENVANVSGISKLLSMFWDGKLNNLICELRSGLFKDVMKEVKEFNSKYLMSDTVILSQIKRESWDKLQQSCLVLKPNDVYREEPYKSSWLNVNEQLNDIDDEFGLPFCLRYYHMQPFENHRETDPVEIITRNPAETMSKVTSTQTKVEKGNCATEDANVAETSTEHPLEAESPDSVDMCYSFKIQVLPPEEAKVLFQQGPQKKATEDQPATLLNATEDKPPEIAEENGSKPAIEEFCCIAKFMEILEHGSSLRCSCQCKAGPSQEDVEMVLHKDKKEVQNEENPRQVKSDDKIYHVVEDDGAADKRPKIFNWPEVCSEFGDIVELTGDDAIFTSCPDREPESITVLSEGDSSSIILISESEDENLFSSETDMPNKGENPEEALAHELEPVQTNEQRSSDVETETENSSSEDEISTRSSDVKEVELKSPAVPQKLLESQAQTQSHVTMKVNLQQPLSLAGTHGTSGIKRRGLRSPERFFSFLKSRKKTKPSVKDVAEDVSVSAVDGPKGRTVELALFGSAPQEDDVLKVGSRSHIASTDLFPEHGPKPPEVISVNLNPLPKMCRETAQTTSPYSVKQRIYEKWKALSPVKLKYRQKFQTQNCAALSEVRHETDGPSCKKELSDRRFCSGKRKHHLSLARSSSYKGLGPGPKRRKKEAFALKQSAEEHVGCDPGNGSRSVLPLQEKNVLAFSVLPNTFNFKDMPNERNDTAVPKTSSSALDKPDLNIKNKDSNLPDKMSRGKWAPNPEKKWTPQPQAMDPNISSVFHEFQKKYMKKQPPME